MSASYVAGNLLQVVDGDELSFDDAGSKVFDFEAYSLGMATLNAVCGIFEPALAFAPTPALVGTHLVPDAEAWRPAVALEYPSAVLAGYTHDVATNTSEYLVQTMYGRAKHSFLGAEPGHFMYATLTGYADSGDHRYALGLAAKDGVVALDVFHNIDNPRGVPAGAFTNPTGTPRADINEMGNAAVTLLYNSSGRGYGLADPVFEPGTMTYRSPITAPLTKKPIVHITMRGGSQYVSLVEVTVAYIRYAFHNAGSDARAQNTDPFAIEVLGTTYTEL